MPGPGATPICRRSLPLTARSLSPRGDPLSISARRRRRTSSRSSIPWAAWLARRSATRRSITMNASSHPSRWAKWRRLPAWARSSTAKSLPAIRAATSSGRTPMVVARSASRRSCARPAAHRNGASWVSADSSSAGWQSNHRAASSTCRLPRWIRSVPCRTVSSRRMLRPNRLASSGESSCEVAERASGRAARRSISGNRCGSNPTSCIRTKPCDGLGA